MVAPSITVSCDYTNTFLWHKAYSHSMNKTLYFQPSLLCESIKLLALAAPFNSLNFYNSVYVTLAPSMRICSNYPHACIDNEANLQKQYHCIFCMHFQHFIHGLVMPSSMCHARVLERGPFSGLISQNAADQAILTQWPLRAANQGPGLCDILTQICFLNVYV